MRQLPIKVSWKLYDKTNVNIAAAEVFTL